MFLALRHNSVVERETLLLRHKQQLTLFTLCHFLQMGSKYFMDASLPGLSLYYQSSHFTSKMLMMIFPNDTEESAGNLYKAIMAFFRLSGINHISLSSVSKKDGFKSGKE